MEYEVLEGNFDVGEHAVTNVRVQLPYSKRSKIHAYILFITNYSTLEQYILYYKLTNKDDLDNILINLQNPGRYTYTLVYLHSKDINSIYTAECIYDTLYQYYTFGGLKYLSKGVLEKHLKDVVYLCKKLDQLYI